MDLYRSSQPKDAYDTVMRDFERAQRSPVLCRVAISVVEMEGLR
jgi:hypothetical protein